MALPGSLQKIWSLLTDLVSLSLFALVKLISGIVSGQNYFSSQSEPEDASATHLENASKPSHSTHFIGQWDDYNRSFLYQQF
jgi:hypothetical protein